MNHFQQNISKELKRKKERNQIKILVTMIKTVTMVPSFTVLDLILFNYDLCSSTKKKNEVTQKKKERTFWRSEKQQLRH